MTLNSPPELWSKILERFKMNRMFEFMEMVADFIFHIDKNLAEIISQFGVFSYVILFFIIFAETGLVVTPFLPGDSLLFAAGAFAALDSLNIWILLISLVFAAVLGDTINYCIGRFLGRRILTNHKVLINRKYAEKTEQFFKDHGVKTIIIARFVPIVRTFAPFVAGIGKMNYLTFLSFSMFGGILWIILFLFGGFFFGNIPAVQHNFTLVIVGIIAISVGPMVYHGLAQKKSGGRQKPNAKKIQKENKKIFIK